MKAFIIVVLVLGVCVAGYFFSGAYNVAASNPDPKLKRWLLSTVSDASVQRHSKGIAVPTLGSPEQLKEGFEHYSGMCEICHGAPGKEPSGLARGLNPRAPRFSRGTDLEPQEIFWVTKYGIGMTGMPAWGSTHTDAEIWDMVSFIQQLHKMTPEQYLAMEQALPRKP